MRKCKSLLAMAMAAAVLIWNVVPALAASYEPDFAVSANAVYLVNLDTGKVIYEKNAYEKIYPASTTKIMTAILALENIPDLDGPQIELKMYIQNAVQGKGLSLAGILRGDKFTPRQLLYATMLPSGNEAAMMLGDYVGDGSMDYFYELMNDKAKEIGAENTHFANANGEHDPDHYTTAYDLYLIAKYAMEVPGFMEIVDTPYYNGGVSRTGDPLHWNNTNKMIVTGSEYYYPPVAGIKTGTTDEAGRCLVSTAHLNGYNYMLVLMGAPMYDSSGSMLEKNEAFLQTKALYEWAFGSFKTKTLIEKGKGVGEVPLKMAQGGKDYLLLMSGDVFTDLLPNEIEPSSITYEVTLPPVVAAPIERGTEIGTIHLMLAGEEVGSVPAVAAEGVKASPIAVAVESFTGLFRSYWAKFALLVVLFSVVTYVGITVLRNYNRNKYRSRRK